MSGAPEDLREKMLQEIRVLDERISAEEVELHERKQTMKELLKEKEDEWRDTVVAGGDVAQMAAAGSRSPEAEGALFLSEVGVLHRDSEEDWRSFGQVKAPPQKRRAVLRAESAETQDYVSALPVTSCMEQSMEAEDEKDMEELSFVPSAVSEPRWACTCVMKSVEKRLQVLRNCGAHTISLCRKCRNERRAKQGEAEVAAQSGRR